MLEIGEIIKRMGMEFIQQSKAIFKVIIWHIQANSLILLSMGMEFKIFQMEMFIEEITSMENLMEKVNIIGVVVLHIKENF